MAPQYLALPRLESSEKATNLANTLPRSLDFKMRLVDKSSRQGLKAKSRGKEVRKFAEEKILASEIFLAPLISKSYLPP